MTPTRPYIGGITAVHQSPLLFRLGKKNGEARHRCAGPGCVTCLWATWKIYRSWVGFWFGWDENDRALIIDNDKEACRILPEDLGL